MPSEHEIDISVFETVLERDPGHRATLSLIEVSLRPVWLTFSLERQPCL